MDEKGFKSGNKLSGQVVTGRAYFALALLFNSVHFSESSPECRSLLA